MSRILNPFIIGKYAGPEFFCDRVAEADLLCQYHLKTASSVQTAIKSLVDKKIMREYHGERQISDLLFVLWLKE